MATESKIFLSPQQCTWVWGGRILKGEDMFSIKEIQDLDLNAFLLYPKVRIHSKNMSFPYFKCILH